jgi:hypothetical protein
MTITQLLRIQGFQRNLAARGRLVRTSASEKLKVLVADIPELADPAPAAQVAVCVYTNITALRSDVTDPRVITTFTEINDDGSDGRQHQVIRYLETAGDLVTAKWECEAQKE